MIYQYRHHTIETADAINAMSKISEAESVVILGADTVGFVAMHCLNKNGISIRCFCDDKEEKCSKTFYGYPVIPVKELGECYPGATILVASNLFYAIKDRLLLMGFQDIFDCSSLFNNMEIKEGDLDMPLAHIIRNIDLYMNNLFNKLDSAKLILPSLDVVVTEKCSLRCRNCSNLMQYYKTPADCDTSIMFSALDNLMNCADSLSEFRVLGGEPFMYKDLDIVINKLGTYKNGGAIVLYTNGTIVPGEKILSSMSNNNVIVYISDYRSLSKNIETLTEALSRSNIEFNVMKVEYWQDCGRINKQRRPLEEIKNIYNICCAKNTLTLLNGLLYHCPFSAHLLNLHPVSGTEADVVDLISEDWASESSKLRLFNFCMNKSYLESCRYCYGRDVFSAKIPVAEQASRALELDI